MRKHLQTIVLLLIFSILLFSCDNFDDVPADENKNEYLIDYDSNIIRSTVEINLLISVFATTYPELAAISDKFNAPVRVYEITYNTTFQGEPKVASGLVCVPNLNGTYPLLSFQNGTNTVHANAPSVAPNSDLFRLLSIMASTGFVITIPDYLGFGASDDMFHPYLDQESTIQTVADMLLATRELIAELDGIEVNNDLYLSGYSQGGWATMQVQKAIESNLSGELNLKASACGAGPYNLIGLTDYVLAEESYPMPFFLGYIMNSYQNLEMTTPIDSVFNEPYAGRISELYDGTLDGEQINAQLSTNVAELFTANFIENWNKPGIFESLYNLLEANSISGYSTSVPTLLIHGGSDTFVPSFSSQNIFNEFITAGVSTDLVHYLELEGLDHQDAIIPAELQSFRWLLQIKDGE